MKKESIYRTYYCSELREKHVGEKIKLAGWVDTIRDLGGVLFIDLRDEYGVTQIKRMYVHNTLNFANVYEKILDEQLGLMAESLDSLSKYRGLIQTFYDEFESDKRE